MKKSALVTSCIMICSIICLLPGVSFSAPIIFNGGAPNQNPAVELTRNIGACDFLLTEPANLTDVHFWTLEKADSVWDQTLQYYVFNDSSGLPASSPWIQSNGQNIIKTATGLSTVISGITFYEYQYSFDLSAAVPLSANTTYWLALHLDDAYPAPLGIYWELTGTAFDNALATESAGPSAGVYSWSQSATGKPDAAFYLTGTTDVPEPSALLLIGAGLTAIGLLRSRFKKFL